MKGASTISASGGVHSRRVGRPEKPACPRAGKGISMLRWLIILPFCLFLQDLRWKGEQEESTGAIEQVQVNPDLRGQ